MARVALIAAATAVAVANAFVPPAGGVLPTLRAGIPHAARDPRTGIALRMSADGPADSKFAKLMADCKDWGLCRFITINPAGAVLETASPMDVGLNFFEIPGKGPYATLASTDKLFECHIRLEAAAKVTFAKEAAKIGGHDLHVMRIKDSSHNILLSCMLQYDPAKGPGTYFDGAVAKFESVRSKWGDEVSLV